MRKPVILLSSTTNYKNRFQTSRFFIIFEHRSVELVWETLSFGLFFGGGGSQFWTQGNNYERIELTTQQ